MITHHMFRLMNSLQYANNFLKTMRKLDLITEREFQVLNHHYHTTIMNKFREDAS